MLGWLLGIVLVFILKYTKKGKELEPTPLLPPTSTERISHNELMFTLKQFAPKASIFLSDRNYLLCNIDDIVRFLEQDGTNRHKYKAEKFDCDDFAYRLMGQFSVPKWADLAFGIIWNNVHAFNCFVSEEGKFYYIEPQTDEVTVFASVKEDANVRFIMM